MMFFRSAFAILPVVVSTLGAASSMAAVRTERPLGQAGRGASAIVAMFCNFGALARLPLVEANAISFTSPLITVALAALILKERVRIYRWSAVTVGFLGVLVMLAPHFERRARSCSPAPPARRRGPCARRLRSSTPAAVDPDPPAGAERDAPPRSCSISRSSARSPGLATWPFGWIKPTLAEFAALISIGLLGGLAHILLTESYRHASASLVAPFDYTSMLWALLLGYRGVRRSAERAGLCRRRASSRRPDCS